MVNSLKVPFQFLPVGHAESPKVQSNFEFVEQYLQARGTVVSVDDYGAVGNGVVDDGAAFTNAYAAVVANGGGILFIPAKNYLVSTNLKPVANTSIIGCGMVATTITYTGAGFWLDNTDSGPTSQSNFTLADMQVICASGLGVARIGDPSVTVFSETNQHIDFTFRNVYGLGNSLTITSANAGSRGLQLTTFIRARIENCLMNYFEIPFEFKKFDEGFVKCCRGGYSLSYTVYVHNDLEGSQVCDETLFIDNSFGVPNAATTSIYLYRLENIRFFNTYIESTASVGNTAIKMNTVYNCTFDGATIGSVDKFFDITDARTLTLRNIGMQNMEQSPVATSTVSFEYGSNVDANGVGGVFQNPFYGQVNVVDCAYQVNESFRGKPGVSVKGTGKYGPGASFFGGTISDVSHLYASQVLDRNGSLGLLKETNLVLSPFSSNASWSALTTTAIVSDATATTGYAIKVPASVNGTLVMNFTYPTDILPGSYEIIARIRNGTAIVGALLTVTYDAILKENYAGVDTATTYKLINARFNFAPANNPSTLAIKFDSSQDLYVDYIVVRPCMNSISLQAFSASDFAKVGTATVPGYRIIYSSAAPVAGTWADGDIVFNTAPASGGFIGWVCTTPGTPGTWSTWGVIS